MAKKINKKLINHVSVTQRTDVGNDQSSQTRLYLYENTYGIGYTADKETAIDLDSYDLLYGYVDVVHPQLLWGTWADNLLDFFNIIVKKLLKAKIACQNDFGYTYIF